MILYSPLLHKINFARLLLLPLGLLLLLGCRPHADAPPAAANDHVVQQDPAAAPPAPDNPDASMAAQTPIMILDTTDLSPEPTTPLKLLLEGTYHKNEVWRGAEKKQWLGLYHENGGYILRPATLHINVVRDPVADSDSVASGREVAATDANALFFVSGLHNVAAGTVDTAAFSSTTIAANKELVYAFEGREYRIKAFGDSVQAASGEYRYQPYGWTVTGTKKGRNVTQKLAEEDCFEDSIYVLLWAGDLDRDGIPDLLLDLSSHYNVSRYALFLSSMAERSQLYKKAAVFEAVGS